MSRRKTTKNGDGDLSLTACQESIGYLFRREGLLRKALTHSSVKDEMNPSNERLEFLGDAILGVAVSEYLFSILPENDEGDLTKIKSVVVSSQSLARLGMELGLDKHLLIGKGIRMKKDMPRSLVANAVEAIIAAVYLDRGMEAARHFVLDHLHRYVEEVLRNDHEEKNYKSLLQQHAQKIVSSTPAYKVLSESGPDHSKRFRVAAVVGRREFPPGTGASKKEAEQSAAATALKIIEEEKRNPRRRQSSGKSGGSSSRNRPARDEPRDDAPDRESDESPRQKKSSRKKKPAARKTAARKAPSRKAPAAKLSVKAPARKSESSPAPSASPDERSAVPRKKPRRRRKSPAPESR